MKSGCLDGSGCLSRGVSYGRVWRGRWGRERENESGVVWRDEDRSPPWRNGEGRGEEDVGCPRE